MATEEREAAPTARLLLIAAIAAGCAVQGYRIGDGNIDRLPDHRGYYLVSVTDTVDVALATRPRHAVVVVVDGMRQDGARRLKALETLAARGQCRTTNNGQLTISRPIYTVLSSGLEADRTGSRNNDETTPVAVASIWQSAREAGLSVSGYSELSWWKQLFPEGFTTYINDDRVTTNLFELAVLTDLTLIHPVYVDYAGHEQGAASTMYADALERLDAELTGFLARLDLDRDLVVVTADHGHSAAGGHGGPEPTVSRVLTCYAGVGVNKRKPPDAPLDARSLAPTLAVLLGVPFPAHMRASDDHLDDIWTVTGDELGEAYVAARKKGIERFRSENRQRIGKWLGTTEASWDQLYQRERSAQLRRAIGAVLLVLLALVVAIRLHKIGWRRGLAIIGWIIATLFVAGSIYALWRGGFGFTSINSRVEFLRYGLSSCGIAVAVATAAHLAIWRRPLDTARDLCLLTVVILALAALHLRVYGDPFGFPLPSDAELFFPFFSAAMIIPAALATTIAAATLALLPRIRGIFRR